MSIQRATYVVILLGAFSWCGVLIAAPYLAAVSSPFGELLYLFFHPICHQVSERSFHLFGEKLAVCSRCASVYFAFILGSALYPFIHDISTTNIPHRNILLLALLPMLVDVGLDAFGLHDSDYVTRTITGAIFGLVVPFFVLPAAIDGVQQLVANKLTTIIEHQKGISNA